MSACIFMKSPKSIEKLNDIDLESYITQLVVYIKTKPNDSNKFDWDYWSGNKHNLENALIIKYTRETLQAPYLAADYVATDCAHFYSWNKQTILEACLKTQALAFINNLIK